MDNLGIVLYSYRRPEQAKRTIAGVVNHLTCSCKVGWYLADDGSPENEFSDIYDFLRKSKQTIIGYHNQRYYPRTGLGWNRGLGACFQFSDYVLVLEDDWELTGNFDMNPQNHPGKFSISPYAENGVLNIDPYLEMLSEREDVGMVRLGGLAVGSTVEIVGHNGHHYLNYLRERQYAYSGNPHLRHARFVRHYGWYAEGNYDPGQLELDYDARFRASPGPDIWRPSDIPGWGIFHHIGQMRYR